MEQMLNTTQEEMNKKVEVMLNVLIEERYEKINAKLYSRI